MARRPDWNDPLSPDTDPRTYRYGLWLTARMSNGPERYLVDVAETYEEAQQRAAGHDLEVIENLDWVPLH